MPTHLKLALDLVADGPSVLLQLVPNVPLQVCADGEGSGFGDSASVGEELQKCRQGTFQFAPERLRVAANQMQFNGG